MGKRSLSPENGQFPLNKTNQLAKIAYGLMDASTSATTVST